MKSCLSTLVFLTLTIAAVPASWSSQYDTQAEAGRVAQQMIDSDRRQRDDAEHRNRGSVAAPGTESTGIPFLVEVLLGVVGIGTVRTLFALYVAKSRNAAAREGYPEETEKFDPNADRWR